jgi:hypothetical protein
MQMTARCLILGTFFTPCVAISSMTEQPMSRSSFHSAFGSQAVSAAVHDARERMIVTSFRFGARQLWE